MKHSPRWGTMGTDTKWETRMRGNENEGGHTGSGLDRSYPELTGVVSERVLTGIELTSRNPNDKLDIEHYLT